MFDDLRHEGPLDSWGYFGAIVLVVGVVAALYADGQLPAVAEQIERVSDTQTNRMRYQRRILNLAALRAAGVVTAVVGLVLMVGDYLQD